MNDWIIGKYAIVGTSRENPFSGTLFPRMSKFVMCPSYIRINYAEINPELCIKSMLFIVINFCMWLILISNGFFEDRSLKHLIFWKRGKGKRKFFRTLSENKTLKKKKIEFWTHYSNSRVFFFYLFHIFFFRCFRLWLLFITQKVFRI